MRAGRDLHVLDGLTVTKTSNEGGDYATVLGTLCLSSGQHHWNAYINHVEDSNLFIGAAACSVGGGQQGGAAGARGEHRGAAHALRCLPPAFPSPHTHRTSSASSRSPAPQQTPNTHHRQA